MYAHRDYSVVGVEFTPTTMFLRLSVEHEPLRQGRWEY